MDRLHFCALVFSFSVAACSDAGTREQLTVVVEADRTRALADQARLAEMQRSLADAQKELADTRKDLTELREKLMKAGALSAEEFRRLEEREARLAAREKRESAVATGLVPGPREDGVSPPINTATATASAASPDYASERSSLIAIRKSKGLRDDDVDGLGALMKKADDANAAGKKSDALAALGDARTKIEDTTINGSFIKKKYARATAHLEKLAPDAKAKAKAFLGDANTKNAKGDAAGANAALNQVLDL